MFVILAVIDGMAGQAAPPKHDRFM